MSGFRHPRSATRDRGSADSLNTSGEPHRNPGGVPRDGPEAVRSSGGGGAGSAEERRKQAAGRTAALAAAGIGTLAAFAGGAIGPLGLGIALSALMIGYGRGQGWRLARALDRPRLFTLLSGAYIPLFMLDLMISTRANPVAALVRLVLFLLVGEVLAGDPSRGHRLILLGLLLLISSAAETTDIWFALPLTAFAAAAAAAQVRATLLAHQPSGSPDVPAIKAAPVAGLVAGSLVLGGAIFLVVPRVGAGWGQHLATGAGQEARLESGLTDEVHLGSLGRVKKRRKVAFVARLRSPNNRLEPDPEALYWRAATYARWTGDGWSKDHETVAMLTIPAEAVVPIPEQPLGPDHGLQSETSSAAPAAPAGPVPEPSSEIQQAGGGPSFDLSAEIETRVDHSPAIIGPGRAVWVRSPWYARLMLGSDGCLREPSGNAPRHYEIAVRLPVRGRVGRGHAGRSSSFRAEAPPTGPGEPPSRGPAPAPFTGPSVATADPALAEYLDAGPAAGDSSLTAWAAGVSPGETEPGGIASAFSADLSRLTYSLDTRAIDPQRPIGSFLAGAPGHCEYFASAMVLGLRLRGVPARVVGGYLGADQSAFGGSQLTVREARAHLWVEAFLPESGWTLYDPTPAEGRAPPSEWHYALLDGWESLVRAWDSTVVGLNVGDQLEVLAGLREAAASAWQAVRRMSVVAALLSSVLMLLAAGCLLPRRQRGAGRRGGVQGDIPVFYKRLLALAEGRGIRPGEAETAREFATRSGKQLGDPDAVWLLSRLYERERFGGRPPSAVEQAATEEALYRLRLMGRSPARA